MVPAPRREQGIARHIDRLNYYTRFSPKVNSKFKFSLIFQAFFVKRRWGVVIVGRDEAARRVGQ
jgi:hypothetical protein